MTLHGANNKRKLVSIGDYRFTGRVLGKGNFARVEEAVHTVLNNAKVAIKIIDLNQIKEKYIVKNLYREAKIMSKLNHPCIVTLFQTIQLLDNVYYLVTELVTGGDLCTFIVGQRYGKLEERPARIYGQQFVSALSHMHSFGVVHRDLKMENVMLNGPQTQIKIADFGLSNTYTTDCPLRTHCGSPEYAAPELFITNKQYGPEVDLWSLGIIFYGMVIGQLPFVRDRKIPNEQRKKLVAQINKGLNITHRQMLSALSPDFRSMIYRLLTVDYTKRITTEELRMHPWITEKGRIVIQIHPIQQLDIEAQSELTKKISHLYKIDQKDVIQEICTNPYGKFGGIYNISVYKYYRKQLTCQQIVLPVQESNSIIINQEKSNQKVVEQAETDSKPQETNTKLKFPIVPKNKRNSKTETSTFQKRPVSTPIRNINQTTPKRQSTQTATIKRTVLKSNKPNYEQRDKKTTTIGDGPLQWQKSNGRMEREKLKTAPVTKSVAGYLVKNVPEKILNLKMLKKQCFHTLAEEKKP